MPSPLSVLALASMLGARHALEPDHLAAVSSIVTAHKNAKSGASVGAAWGLGHTLSLFIVGAALSVLHTQLPARLGAAFELIVATMLVVLGGRSVLRAASISAEGAVHLHSHGPLKHYHRGPPSHLHIHRRSFARLPFVVGLMHGLAGSGALTVLAMGNLRSIKLQIVYMILFGLGSIAGMTLLSGLAGVPLATISRRPVWSRGLNYLTGTFSIILGTVWGWNAL